MPVANALFLSFIWGINMIYYNENLEIIPESAVDLKHGYLTDYRIIHNEPTPAITHEVLIPIPGSYPIAKTVVDQEAQPGGDIVVSQIYHRLGPTQEELDRAQLYFTAIMTDTLMEED